MTVLHRHIDTRVRSSFWLPALFAVLFLAVYLPLASQLLQVTTPVAAVSAQSTTTVTSRLPQCTPLSFSTPAAPTLYNAAPGLTVQADTPVTYQIYGNTAADLHNQIAHCAPGAHGNGGAEFTGQTSYDLTWQYSVVNDGSCHLTNVKVGLHTVITLPDWQPTASANAGLPQRWQTFINALGAHEAGHATLDKLYAQKLLNDLNGLGIMDCASVTSTVRAVTSRDVTTLNHANDTYDNQTGHGTTQGAVLPTH